MPLTFPDSPTIYDTYIDSTGVTWEYDGVAWNTIQGTQYKTFNGAKVRLVTSTSLSSIPTPLDYDVEDFDTGDYYTSYDATKITIRVAGYYRVAGTFYTGSSGIGSSYTFSLRLNGTDISVTEECAANQAANYDTTLYFNAGSYFQILVSESSSTGTLLSGSYVEIHRLGAAPGAAVTNADVFSGVRVSLSDTQLATSTLTAVTWSATDFDVNSDVFGNTYWNGTTRLTIKTAGYYQIKSFITTNSDGAENTYTLRLRKNNTSTITTATLSPNDNAIIDELYSFAADDYIELQLSNSGSVGGIIAGSYLEIIRAGI